MNNNAIILTRDEYFEHSGINLELSFMGGESDDGTGGSTRFLRNVSEDIWDYLRAHFFFDEHLFIKASINDPNIVRRYKKALCHQVDYLLSSGDKMKSAEMVNIFPNIKNLAPRAKQIFRSLGLTNIQPINRRGAYFY